jgi:hypothetical protein
MSVIATAVQHMLAAGMSHEAIVNAVRAMECEPKPVATQRPERVYFNAKEWDDLRRQVFMRDGYACVYCAADVSAAPQCDHYIPLVLGGGSALDNLRTACKRCNSSKSGKHPEEWLCQ